MSVPPVFGEDWKIWARNLSAYLQRAGLPFQTGKETAAQDAVLMWEPSKGQAVVSKGGAWRELAQAGMPVFADNAAAIAGGLGVGEFYQTAGGAVRIVV